MFIRPLFLPIASSLGIFFSLVALHNSYYGKSPLPIKDNISLCHSVVVNFKHICVLYILSRKTSAL